MAAVTLPIDESVIGRLAAAGIRITGKARLEGNQVIYDPDSTRVRDVEIEFGYPGNTAILALDDALKGSVRFWGPNNTFRTGGSPNSADPVWIDVRMASSESEVSIGPGTTSNGLLIVTQGRGKRVNIGRDCMFAHGVVIRNADMHAIVDLSTWQTVNPQGDVRIEDHVWLGQESMILRDVVIGRGSIIGAKALVTSSIPGKSVAGGVPCRILKSGFSWTRSPTPDEHTLSQLREVLSPQ